MKHVLEYLIVPKHKHNMTIHIYIYILAVGYEIEKKAYNLTKETDKLALMSVCV